MTIGTLLWNCVTPHEIRYFYILITLENTKGLICRTIQQFSTNWLWASNTFIQKT